MAQLTKAGRIAQGVFIHVPPMPRKAETDILIEKIVGRVIGPEGDPDGDGIPNNKDPDPFKPAPRVPSSPSK